jgi:hypothetical protein
MLTITFPSQATAGMWFDVIARLTTADGHNIPRAQINDEERFSHDERWVVLKDSTTTNVNGIANMQLKSPISCEIHVRVTYGGNYQYAALVSEEAIVMVD